MVGQAHVARTIYILVIRSSVRCKLLSFYFNPVFDNIRLVTSSSTSDFFEELLNGTRTTLFFGISFPR